MYEGGAKKEQQDDLAAFGLRLVTEEPADTECDPDNWLPLQVFSALSTQWNASQGIVHGLRYEVLPAVMDMLGIEHKERAGIFQSLRIMEEEALLVFNKK